MYSNKLNSKGFTHLLLILTLGLLFGVGTGFISFNKFTNTLRPSNNSANAPQQQEVLATFTHPIIVDHNSVALFDQIPDQYIEAAKNMRMLFIDRSVGGNINDGLTCMSYPSAQSAPYFCKKPDLATSELVTDSKYSRSNWVYRYWDSTGDCSSWQSKIRCFMEMSTRDLGNFDVLSYQNSYLEVLPGSSIDNTGNGYFYDNTFDIRDLEAFEAANPSKTIVHWTSSLARSIGTPEAENFNNQMRNYARQNNKPLIDSADILSHNPQGNPCYDNRDGVPYGSENYPDDGLNTPAICKEYTTESDGGHLGSHSAGMNRMAKAVWVMMAQLAGWDPGNGTVPTPPPPPPPPTPEPTPVNQAPVVNAGSDQTTTTGTTLQLSGTVTDDGLPNNTLLTNWEFRSGPQAPVFGNAASRNTSATFAVAGSYVLRLNANDSQLTAYDDMVVSVSNPPVPPSDGGGTPSTGGIISEWKFDSQEFNNEADNCTNCSVNGATWSSIGLRGGAFSFDGVNDYLNFGSLDALNGLSNFSVSLWVKPNFNQTSTTWSYVLSYGRTIDFFYLSNKNDWRLALTTENGRALLDTPDISWNSNTWSHMVVTYDGTNSKLYWNGQLVTQKPQTGRAIPDAAPKYFGTSIIKSNYFNGMLDELRFYNKTLTDQEVQDIYTAR